MGWCKSISLKLNCCFASNKFNAYVKSLFLSSFFFIFQCRAVTLWKRTQTLHSTSTLLATSRYMTVPPAVVAGISPSMAPSATLLGPLMAYSTLEHQTMLTTISTIIVISKVIVKTFKKDRCEWDFWLETVNAVDISSGTPSPGGIMQWIVSSSRKYHQLSSRLLPWDQVDF